MKAKRTAPASETRRTFTMRFLDADEEARFQTVAEHHGINVSNVLRMLVKQEEQRITRATEDERPKATRRSK